VILCNESSTREVDVKDNGTINYTLWVDVYRETFGFRTVAWTENQILINEKPFYCLGFGMHEDFEIHGRGHNQAVMTKDMNLLEWMNGNCYRTSHYPYAEERMAESDRRGIAVVAESQAAQFKRYSNGSLELYMKLLKELIDRDKNHPSVIMWSISNEPKNLGNESMTYLKKVVEYAKELDKTRPVSFAFGGINQSTGIDDTVEPSVPFSEQYQNDLIKQAHIAFDILRNEHRLAGEMIWNFADFATGMSYFRPVGNHKGVFTRTRQAKMAAYTLRDRYFRLFNQTNLEKWNSSELLPDVCSRESYCD
ncbi:glycosyl hydrolase family 2, TIM barrel domain protein, partial [Oesophagostomum dentatum]